MTKQMIGAAAVACLCTATMMAQAGAGNGTQAKSHESGAAGQIRVTGCVERADQVMPLGGAALGTTVDSQDFVLIHSQIAGRDPVAAAPSATGTAGVAAAGTKPDSFGQVFRLDAAAALLNPQVGHQVEVVGSRDMATVPPSGRAEAAVPSAVPVPLLHVASVKTVGDTCAR